MTSYFHLFKTVTGCKSLPDVTWRRVLFHLDLCHYLVIDAFYSLNSEIDSNVYDNL
jgi:hypothetical protein